LKAGGVPANKNYTMSLPAAAAGEHQAALALAQWMRSYDWHHYVTLTTARFHSRDALCVAFKSGYVRRLAREAQRRIGWWFVLEDSADGRPHVHALLWGTDVLAECQLHRAWPAGRCHVVAYDPSRGAAHYMVKTFWRELDWDCSRILPPLVDIRS
jgi:hypothetical protein